MIVSGVYVVRLFDHGDSTLLMGVVHGRSCRLSRRNG